MIDYLVHFVKTVLLAVGALLPIIDPLGGAPIYLAMTAGLRSEHRGPMAKAVAVNSGPRSPRPSPTTSNGARSIR